MIVGNNHGSAATRRLVGCTDAAAAEPSPTKTSVFRLRNQDVTKFWQYHSKLDYGMILACLEGFLY